MIAERIPPRRQTSRRAVQGAALAVALTLATPPALARDLWLGGDKALHFGVTFTLAGGGYLAAAPLRQAPVVRLGVVVTLVMAVGIGKEMRDRTSGGDPSLRDLTWDALGTAAGLAVGWLIDRYLLSGGGRR
jgi:putative lipoprotein